MCNKLAIPHPSRIGVRLLLLQDVIEVIEGDSMQVTLPEQVAKLRFRELDLAFLYTLNYLGSGISAPLGAGTERSNMVS